MFGSKISFNTLLLSFVVLFFMSSCTQRRYGHLNFQRNGVKNTTTLVKNEKKATSKPEKQQHIDLAMDEIEPISFEQESEQISLSSVAEKEHYLENQETQTVKLKKSTLLPIARSIGTAFPIPKRAQKKLKHFAAKVTKSNSQAAHADDDGLLYVLIVIILILLILSLVSKIVGPWLWSLIVLAALILLLGWIVGWW